MFSCKAEFVTISGAYWGEIEITDTHFVFKSLNEDKPDIEKFWFGAQDICMLKDFILK